MTDNKPVVAVLFGGRSVEHDVSILTGLQFLEALDITRYRGLPVYVAPNGQWWTGDALLRRQSYPLRPQEAQPITLAVGVPSGQRPHLLAPRKGLMGQRIEEIPFDVMVPAMHGSNGEDGSLQGLLAFNGLPFAGASVLASAATMDKHFTKTHLRGLDVPVLDHLLIHRPAEGTFLDPNDVAAQLQAILGADAYPVIAKPRHLGSSIGVTRADDLEQLLAALVTIFRMDRAALVEPMVPELVEYNIAVRRDGEDVLTSAIERPTGGTGLLDFDSKYQSGGPKAGPKTGNALSEGMASANRILHPEELTDAQTELISRAAKSAALAFDLRGSSRIDFLCNGQTGELWLNEINAIPGSFAYYLWQAASPSLSFTELTSHIVEEGLTRHRYERGETSAAAGKSRLFGRG